MITVGKRVDKPPHELEDGEYSRYDVDENWYACCPGTGRRLVANLASHTVVEHDDGTITVSPSIECRGSSWEKDAHWHGFLEKGVWKSV